MNFFRSFCELKYDVHIEKMVHNLKHLTMCFSSFALQVVVSVLRS